MSITVSDEEGGRLINALVVLDNQQKSYTNDSGVANFAGVKSGKHTITITAKGLKQHTATVSLSPGQNKLVTYQLDKATVTVSRSTSSRAGIDIIVGVVLVVAAVFWHFKLRHRKLPWSHEAAVATPPTAANLSPTFTPPAALNEDKPKFIR